MKTISDLFADWQENIKPEVIAQYGERDEVALSESWNDFTDAECKDGNITDLQYHYCPAWDDRIPDRDAEFILEAMGVTFAAAQVSQRPDVFNSGWHAGATHWRVLIQRGNQEMTAHYSMGSAHKGEPVDADVFHCLLSDSDGIEGTNFETWAHEFGYDSDSRKAERIFNACEQTLTDLQRLFSASELSDLREIFSDY